MWADQYGCWEPNLSLRKEQYMAPNRWAISPPQNTTFSSHYFLASLSFYRPSSFSWPVPLLLLIQSLIWVPCLRSLYRSFLIFKINCFKLCVCECSPLHVSVLHIGVWYPKRPEEGSWVPGTGAGGCEPRRGIWELNHGPLQEQAGLLITELPRQPRP